MRYLPGKRVLCAAMLLVMPPLVYGGGPPFKSTLIPCTPVFACAVFEGIEPFKEPEESLTEGLASVGATGTLKVTVKGAEPNVQYMILIPSGAPPGFLLNTLNTDENGNGSAGNVLDPETYLSTVYLLRDTDLPDTPGFGVLEPRIQTGFVLEP